MPNFSPLSMQLAFLNALLITLSPVSIGALLAGVAILVVVGFGFTALPARWKLPAIVLSAGLIALGVLWQLAEAEGRKKVLIRAHTIALQAETIRADIAEQTTREIGAQAVRDAEAHELALQAKKEVDHAADVHPDRDRVAVPRDLARGLRALQRSGAH